MGKRHRARQRRAGERRGERRRERAGRGGGRATPPRRGDAGGEGPVAVETVVGAAVEAFMVGHPRRCAEVIELLVEAPRFEVDRVLAVSLEGAVAGAWRRGWQPAGVVRAVRRELSAAHAVCAGRAVAAEATRYAAATVDPRWAAQLADIRAASPTAGSDRRSTIGQQVEVLAVLRALRPIPRLLPLPGEYRSPSAGSARATGVDGRLLERVRALLAKAESTTFPEEADALTAKAQELMSRHAIDQAMLDAGRGAQGGAEGRRIAVDDPYASPKSLLLARVADANRCRAVWVAKLGFSDVFGAPSDLDTVELLFTSLLRQATTAMLAEGTRTARPGGGGTRSFRHSFLVAFAVRIGQRLDEQDRATTAAAADHHGAALLPVLASRAAAAVQAAGAAFPHTRSTGASANDVAGWAAGRAAADRADLGVPRGQVEPAAG